MKRFLCSVGRFARGHRLASRLLSVLLTLLLIFYIVPPIIYTKAAEAIGKEDAEAAITEDVDKVASPNPYLYESTSYVKHYDRGQYIISAYKIKIKSH